MKVMLAKFYAFLSRPIRPWSRFVLLGLAALLVLSYFWPLWRISMEAPQYPRGLYMDIWSYTIEGGNEGQHLQEINGLNHYIGMREIDPADFKDLDWMPFGIGILILLTLRVAAIGNIRSLIDLTVVSVYLLGFMGARFIYKLYVYGHELDPEAPVTIEPFTPVIVGTKQIANFTTHSLPQLGTLWLVLFITGLVLVTGWHLVAGRRAAKRAGEEEAAPTGRLVEAQSPG